MESFISFPDQRLFHLDRECYLVYVGTDPKDDRPFIRIGSGRIPREALPEIGTVLVTPSYTGNPYYEKDNIDPADPSQCRYVGDGEISRLYGSYLSGLKLSSVHVQDYSELTESGHRSVAYFYDDGNITLSFKSTILFNLFRRERQDHHFLAAARTLAAKLAAYSYRYSGQLYRNAAFFVADGCFFHIAGDRITAYGLPLHYFETLYRLGIDPDRITSIITDVVSDEVVNWLKRRRNLRGACSVRAPESEHLRSLAGLLSLKEISFSEPAGSPGEGSFSTETGFRLRSDGADLVYPSRKGRKSIRIRYEGQGGVFEGSSGEFFVPQGIPVVIETALPSRDDCLKRFVNPLPELFRGCIRPEEYRLCAGLRTSLADPGSVTRPEFSVPGELRSPFLPYFLRNCLSFALLEELRKESGKAGTGNPGLVETLRALLGRCGGEAAHLPFIGILLPESGLMFYTYPHASYSELLHSQHLHAASGETSYRSGREAFHTSERERLVDFIRELERGRAYAPKPMPVRPPMETAPRRAETVEKPKGPEPRPVAPSDPVFRKPASRSVAGLDLPRLGRYVIPALTIVAVCAGGFVLWNRFRKPAEKVEPYNPEPKVGAPPLGPDSDGESVSGPEPRTGDIAEPAMDTGTVSGPSGASAETPSAAAEAPAVTGSTVPVTEATPEPEPAPFKRESTRQAVEPQEETRTTAESRVPGEGAVQRPVYRMFAASSSAANPPTDGRQQEKAPVALPLISSAPATGADEIVPNRPVYSAPASPAAHDAGSVGNHAEPTAGKAAGENGEQGVPGSETVSKYQDPEAELPVEIYTYGHDTIAITWEDVIVLADRISRINGKGAAGSLDNRGSGSRWPAPGSIILLPNGVLHTVEPGEKLWDLSLGLIRENLNTLFSECNPLRTAGDPAIVRNALELIRQRSYSEEFIRFIDSWVKRVGNGA